MTDITESKRAEEALQNAYNELEYRVADRTRELSALYAVAAVASESLDLKMTLERVLAHALAAIKTQVGGIHLLDEEGQVLHLAAYQSDLPELAAQAKTIPLGRGLIGQVLEHSGPLTGLVTDQGMVINTTPWGFDYYAVVPVHAAGQGVGVLSALRKKEQSRFSEDELALLTIIADQVGAVIESARLRQQAEQAAVLQERQRLARELHDSVTQALYSATLLSDTGRKAAAAGDLSMVERCLAPLGQTTQQALKEMRLLVYELRPPVLKEAGLLSALQQRLEAVEDRASIKHRLLVEGELELTAFQEENLYRIALEALNNSLKHAAASTVTVRIRADEQAATLEVTDDGCGFDPSSAVETGGMGLVTMRERAEQMDGTLTIHSTPGQGTEVTVALPSGGASGTSHDRNQEVVQ
jgi:signal transduction histidine kinase